MPDPFMTQVMAEARRYVAAYFKLDDIDLPAAQLRTTVAAVHLGGWNGFIEEFRRSYRPVNDLSPIKVRARVEHFLGRKLKKYDNIVSFAEDDDSITIVLSRAIDVTEYARSDKVTRRSLELHRSVRTEDGWKRDTVVTEEDVDEVHHHFGRVNTVERDMSNREQYETCYRPGTEKSPMKGWVARLEVSHAEAHDTEEYPK